MALDVASIVGAENMTPDAKDRVIELFRQAGLPKPALWYLYGRWARIVEVPITREDLERVAPGAGRLAGRMTRGS